MKAFYIIKYGGPEADKYGDLPDPFDIDDNLLIEVKAVSINPVDYKVKSGDLKFLSGSNFPKILGSDFAGVLKEVPPGITGFKAGDRIYGFVSTMTGNPGTFSELITVKPEYARHIPDGMSFGEAASIPVASLTALSGMRKCGVTAGSHLLINGGTGGIGHFAIQMAKVRGAVVTVTCSDANRELAKKLGADEVSGYKKEDLAKISEKFDAIFDTYGKMDYEDAYRLLKRKGVYASTHLMPKSAFSAIFAKLIYGKTVTAANLRSLPEDYEEIERLFNEKKLKPLIENIFPLEKSSDAFVLAEKGKSRGKIIITVGS
jgi:NADPH:quinone reductase-like Zn-dependent oxidoreductase